MALDLNAIIGQIGRDKGIDKQVLVEAVESAMLSAARKHYGHNLNLETKFDPDTGMIELLQFKVVVEQVEDSGTQLSVQEARREYDSEAMVGDEFGKRLDTDVLGRIAAQTAKQVIIQKFRDAERSVIFDEYKNSKGQLINGIVQRYDRGNVIVNLGRTEAILPKREQITKERYRQNDRIRCMILNIDRSARGPQIVLTRSHPDFLAELFKVEVPEIQEGVIEIKGVAREPGERAKIAVYSKDNSIDPVGACVGIKGSRVHAIVQELRGEKIDIIPWTPDEPSFVARSLSPAEVSRVVVDEDNHAMEVVVADDQLSFAIGRRGNNVKLASKLTGWKLDVRSVSVAEEESKRARASIEAIPGIQFTHAELLFQEGYRNAQEIAEANLEDLLEIAGFDEDVANQIIRSAKEFVASMPEAEDGISITVSDLDKLMLGSELTTKLTNAGYKTIQDLVVGMDSEGFVGLVTEDEAIQIRNATDNFFSRSNNSLSKGNENRA
jgi:N utilization substance protein A